MKARRITIGQRFAADPWGSLRYAVSTSRPLYQVFIVDAVVVFVATYLALVAYTSLEYGFVATRFRFGMGFAGFMAALGGGIGVVGARDRGSRGDRSAIRTVAATILLPVVAVGLLAYMANGLNVLDVTLMASLFAPTVAVAGYRILGFRPKQAGNFRAKAVLWRAWFSQQCRWAVSLMRR